jgi:membrane protein DedA with SNARE-associated domain
MNWLWIEETLRAGHVPLVLAGLALATLVSEDIACVSGGVLVAAGKLAFWPVTLACFAGIFTGDLLLVAAGWWGGRRALTVWPLRSWVSAGAVDRAGRWFVRRGGPLILTSRFLPGTRLPVYVAAGVLRVPLGRFIPWFGLACALWTPLLVGVAVFAGGATLGWLEKGGEVGAGLLVGGVMAWVLIRIALGVSTWRGRRLWLSRWRRLTRWEFWPMWAVYPPVVLYGIWLGFKHRGFTVFTAANPGIGAGGGLVGESKSDILSGLADAGGTVAAWVLVPPGADAARLEIVRRFANAHGYPLVLKPDVGERGAGVVIVRDEAGANAALTGAPEALIAQAYVPGVEYGVFYYRHPRAASGQILAITDKRMPELTGDGRRTWEELILADARAVCMAEFFLKKFSARLDEVPAAGERLALTELGTHCRGALFLDGAHLLTPELHAAVERTSRAFIGFYFGRYDVRTTSEAAFRAGNFKVIELNGLTSEATSIYDPRHSVWFGWRMLMRQWRLAFEIGAANRERGVRVLAVREIWSLLNG